MNESPLSAFDNPWELREGMKYLLDVRQGVANMKHTFSPQITQNFACKKWLYLSPTNHSPQLPLDKYARSAEDFYDVREST